MARSASPIGPSLNRSPAKHFGRTDHPGAPALLLSRHPPLRGGEYSVTYVTPVTYIHVTCCISDPGTTMLPRTQPDEGVLTCIEERSGSPPQFLSSSQRRTAQSRLWRREAVRSNGRMISHRSLH